MKLSDFLEAKSEGKELRPININYVNDNPKKGYDINDLKVIGITGSTGKSTTAFIIHKYLKELGKKSVLYSSITVDSPASLACSDTAYEIACRDENSLLSIVNEAKEYEAEYLVLEVNESSLEKGIFQGFPFDVRVLTNLLPAHNLARYTKEEYVNIKKSFFTNIDTQCQCVFGFQNYTKELLNEFLELSKSQNSFVCTNRFIQEKYGVDNVDCLLYGCKNTLDGLELKIKLKEEDIKLSTKLCMFHNAMNLLTALTVLQALGLFDEKKFNKAIKNIVVPGRTELYKVNGRIIVIDNHLPKVLENLKEYKDNNEITSIKVVLGSIGSGFRTWDDRFKSNDFIEKHHQAKRFAINLVSRYADYVCFTESDSGKESPLDICQELKSYLDETIESKIIVDREEAIRDTIINSSAGDAIFISGRGNRDILCCSETKVKHIKDSDVVVKILKELGWSVDEK